MAEGLAVRALECHQDTIGEALSRGEVAVAWFQVSKPTCPAELVTRVEEARRQDCYARAEPLLAAGRGARATWAHKDGCSPDVVERVQEANRQAALDRAAQCDARAVPILEAGRLDELDFVHRDG